MSRPRFIPLCLGLGLVVSLTADRTRGADNQPAVPEGYKMVHLQTGGDVLVQKPDPYKNAGSSSSSDGKYRPDNMNFSLVNAMANKPFSETPSSMAKNDALVDSHNKSAYVTKTYEDPQQSAHGVVNQDTKYSTASSAAYAHNSSTFAKSYPTSDSKLGGSKIASYPTKESADQEHTAAFTKNKTDTFASKFDGKTYTGPGVDEVKRDIDKMNEGLMNIKDLPNRPLTIDEVRALINHGVKPDTSEPPAPPSKALNDPDYKPEPSPEPPMPDAPGPVNADDKNDPVPSPGTMAQPPENSEPLPQH